MNLKRWLPRTLLFVVPIVMIFLFQNCSKTSSPIGEVVVDAPALPSSSPTCSENFTLSSNGDCVPSSRACNANDGSGYQTWMPSENKWGICSLYQCDFSGYDVPPVDTSICAPLVSNAPMVPSWSFFEGVRYYCKDSPNVLCDDDGVAVQNSHSIPGIRTLLISNSQTELMVRLIFGGSETIPFTMVSLFNRLNVPDYILEQNGVDPKSLPPFENIVFIIRRDSQTLRQTFKMFDVKQENFQNLFSSIYSTNQKPVPMFEGALMQNTTSGFSEIYFKIPLERLPKSFGKNLVANATMFQYSGGGSAVVVDSTGEFDEKVLSFSDVGMYGYWNYTMKIPNVLETQ